MIRDVTKLMTEPIGGFLEALSDLCDRIESPDDGVVSADPGQMVAMFMCILLEREETLPDLLSRAEHVRMVLRPGYQGVWDDDVERVRHLVVQRDVRYTGGLHHKWSIGFQDHPVEWVRENPSVFNVRIETFAGEPLEGYTFDEENSRRVYSVLSVLGSVFEGFGVRGASSNSVAYWTRADEKRCRLLYGYRSEEYTLDSIASGSGTVDEVEQGFGAWPSWADLDAFFQTEDIEEDLSASEDLFHDVLNANENRRNEVKPVYHVEASARGPPSLLCRRG